jgi:hypothetical protein
MRRRCAAALPDLGPGNRSKVGAAPAGEGRSSHPGGPGTRSGGNTTPPRGARCTENGILSPSQETRTRGQKSPHAERREATRPDATGRARRSADGWRRLRPLVCAWRDDKAPFGAPSPPIFYGDDSPSPCFTGTTPRPCFGSGLEIVQASGPIRTATETRPGSGAGTRAARTEEYCR